MLLSSFGLTLLCMLFAGPSGSFGSWLCTGVVAGAPSRVGRGRPGVIITRVAGDAAAGVDREDVGDRRCWPGRHQQLTSGGLRSAGGPKTACVCLREIPQKLQGLAGAEPQRSVEAKRPCDACV